tara:strand:- start:212 stop:457 length:246 start_codon:yes stop_codon:yes gene_type:complete
MSETDLEARKIFQIEVKTDINIWADSKEEAIKKFKDEYVNYDYDDPYHPQYDFEMTGKMWEVSYEPEHNWVKLLINEKKEI